MYVSVLEGENVSCIFIEAPFAQYLHIPCTCCSSDQLIMHNMHMIAFYWQIDFMFLYDTIMLCIQNNVGIA